MIAYHTKYKSKLGLDTVTRDTGSLYCIALGGVGSECIFEWIEELQEF